MDWKLYSIEMDEGGMEIGEHFQNQGCNITRVNPLEGICKIGEFVPDHRKSMNKDSVAKTISNCIKTDSKVLALYGHGGYHFFTYGLAMLANRLSDEFGYIHIDHHDDSWFINWDEITCASFVQQICNDTHIYGSCSRMLYIGNDGGARHGAYRGNAIRYDEIMGVSLVEEALDKLKVNDVYVSIDLDVMDLKEVRTAFDRGNMKAEKLYTIVEQIKQRKNIISADIVGYTTSNQPRSAYDGKSDGFEDVRDEEEPSFEKSMKVYETIARIIRG
jgi:arginase family enzyme